MADESFTTSTDHAHFIEEGVEAISNDLDILVSVVNYMRVKTGNSYDNVCRVIFSRTCHQAASL
jgi:hypothetical protein